MRGPFDLVASLDKAAMVEPVNYLIYSSIIASFSTIVVIAYNIS
jgi:hypothetical protein